MKADGNNDTSFPNYIRLVIEGNFFINGIPVTVFRFPSF